MARMLSRTLLCNSTWHSRSVKILPFIPLSFCRQRSYKAQLIEIDLDSSASSSSSSSDGGSESDVIVIKKLEDMVRRIIVQKSTPYWLPFIPGSSFWVPPPRDSSKIGDLVDQLTNQLTEEQFLSLTTVRGWPCSAFFIKDTAHTHSVEVDVEFKVPKEEGLEVEVEVLTSIENISATADEEE